MQRLIDILGDNLLYVVFIGAWILSMVGGTLARAARKAEQQRRAAQGGRPMPTSRPLSQAPPTRRPAPQGPATQRPVARPAQPTAEEIAAEIRRVMGMEEPPRPTPVRRAPAPPPEPVPVTTPSSQFEHFAEDVGELRSKVDPHVGEGVSARDAPTSGVVGSRQLGSLGGGLTQQARRRVKKRVKRFDLSDPAAVLVTLEILGKPRALRDFEF